MFILVDHAVIEKVQWNFFLPTFIKLFFIALRLKHAVKFSGFNLWGLHTGWKCEWCCLVCYSGQHCILVIFDVSRGVPICCVTCRLIRVERLWSTPGRIVTLACVSGITCVNWLFCWFVSKTTHHHMIIDFIASYGSINLCEKRLLLWQNRVKLTIF